MWFTQSFLYTEKNEQLKNSGLLFTAFYLLFRFEMIHAARMFFFCWVKLKLQLLKRALNPHDAFRFFCY